MRFCRCMSLLLLGLSSFLIKAKAQDAKIDSLRNIVQENKRDAEESKAMNLLATLFTRIDMSKAKAYAASSIDIATALRIDQPLSVAYSLMVTLQLNTGHADSSGYYLALLKKLAADNGSIEIKTTYDFSAGLFYKIQGNFKEALPYMVEALNHFLETDKKTPSLPNRVSIAGQYLNIGNIYTSLGDYKSALRYHIKGLQLFEETENKKGQSFCYQGISGDFISLNQYAQALPYGQKAIALKQELNDKRGMATAFGDLGTIYQGLSQYDRALEYDMKSLKVTQEMKLTADGAKANFNIGRLYALKKDPVNATLYFQNSRLLAQQLGDSSQAAAVDAELIALRTNINQEQHAERKLMSSLKTSVEMGDKNTELSTYKYLSDLYAGDKQFEKALEYSDKFHRVNDSLQSKDIQLQIKRLEEQYNLEKKEQEIVLLKKDQQLSKLSLQKQKTFQYGAILFFALLLVIGFLIINRYRVVHNARRLIEMERMRNNIARDLHDDIGSTLTSINILSKMALEHAHTSGETLIASSLQKIKDRSSAIMESVSDIVWAINPHNDTVEKMIYRMKEFASELLDPLRISYTFQEEGNLSAIKLDIKKRKDFYLVFKEAVNNAAKYSHCRNLTIHLQQDQQFLHLKVADDGKGFNEQEVRNGNGLGNMRARAASMQAGIRIDTAISKGTHIEVDVPIA